MILKWRKLPVVVETVKWVGNNEAEIIKFCLPRKAYLGSKETNPKGIVNKATMIIETLEGNHEAKLWDIIIKGVEGECYPCDEAIFDKTYEIVEELDE